VDRLAQVRRDGALDGYTATSQFVPSVARQKENRALVRQRLMDPYLGDYLRQIGYEGTVDDVAPSGFLTPGVLPKAGPLAMLSVLDIADAGHPAHVVLLHGLKNVDAVKASVADLPGVRMVGLADDWSRLFADYRRYAIVLLALSALLMYPLLAWRYGLGRGIRVLAPSLAGRNTRAPAGRIGWRHIYLLQRDGTRAGPVGWGRLLGVLQRNLRREKTGDDPCHRLGGA